MCGIAGFANFGGHDVDAARRRIQVMSDAQSHRGPDADGFFVDSHVALGHRRLAIIDLHSGQQPMSVLDGQVQLIFNGEIYNYQSVRSELQNAGHRFRTNSDTEVILYAYLEWGADCVSRLFGMFAFAIWDARDRRLFLARDRVGKKPLYIARSGSTIAFASEIKALQAGATELGDVDKEALDCYLTMGYVPSPRTIYSNIRKLRPAHTLIVAGAGETERCYWQLNFTRPQQRTFAEAAEEFEQIFDEAVGCRLMSEVPLGAFLSGGIDSSLVVSSMSRLLSSQVKTHTIGFDDAGFSETQVAKEIAAHLNTAHQEFNVEPRAAEVLEKIAWHFDEPFADSSALPTWYVCEMTRQSVTVALSGDGGDEGFGGYTFRYLPHVLESRIRSLLPPALRSILFGPLGAAWPGSARLPKPLRLKSIFQNLAIGDGRAFFRDMTWLQEDVRQRLYSADFMRSLKGFTPMETVLPYYLSENAEDPLARSQFADINVYMTDDVLAKVDRMSMAHSLEVRAPLLDHRVLEFAASLLPEQKMKLREGKVLLRNLAGARLPERIRKMPKMGFSIPAAKWLRTDLRDLVEQFVMQDHGIIAESLDRAVLSGLWQEHLSGSRDHSVFLWGLMMLGLWGSANSANSHG